MTHNMHRWKERTMICKVNFRDVYSKDFNNGPYTYICNIEVEPGDLVIVKTRYGLSLARVITTNLKLMNDADLSKLQNVVEKCKTRFDDE